jgi:hypothetical protein
MDKSGKRGKIPQSDWPLIMMRYEAGETLASIARTYDCSPPAISYIVSRSRTRQSAAEPAPAAAEPQLVKAHGSEAVPEAIGNGAAHENPAGNGAGLAASLTAEPQLAPANHEHNGNGMIRDGNGTPRHNADERHSGMSGSISRPMPPRPNPAASNGESRRRLHLSLGGNGSNGPVPGPSQETHLPGNGIRNPVSDRGFPQAPRSSAPFPPPAVAERSGSPQPSVPSRDYDHREQPRYAQPPGGERGYGDNPGRTDAEPTRRKDDPGTFIDQELRARVDADIAGFLAAFDAALAADTEESRTALREATDRLLRAGARTRIELERLEARVPLSPRGNDRRVEPNWRHR